MFVRVSAFDGGVILVCSLNRSDLTDLFVRRPIRSWDAGVSNLRQVSPVKLVSIVEQNDRLICETTDFVM